MERVLFTAAEPGCSICGDKCCQWEPCDRTGRKVAASHGMRLVILVPSLYRRHRETIEEQYRKRGWRPMSTECKGVLTLDERGQAKCECGMDVKPPPGYVSIWCSRCGAWYELAWATVSRRPRKEVAGGPGA